MTIVGLRRPYTPSLVGVGCGCRAAPRPVTSTAEGEALELPFTDEDRRNFWLHVGGEPVDGPTTGQLLAGAAVAAVGLAVL